VPELLARAEALSLAKRSLRSGEELATVASVPLDGTGGGVVRISATTEDGVRDFVVAPDGSVLDPQAVFAKNDADYAAFYGKMTRTLYEKQAATIDPTSRIDFLVRITGEFESVTPPVTDRFVSTEEFEAWITGHRKRQKIRLDALKHDTIGWLRGQGARITENYESLPLLEVSAPVAVLRSAYLNSNPGVVEMMEPQVDNKDAKAMGYMGHGALNEASLTGGLCAYPGRCYGQNLKVGIWEIGLGDPPHAIALTNPHYFPGTVATYMNTPQTCTTDADCSCFGCDPKSIICDTGRHVCIGEHVSFVAAMVGMYGLYKYPPDARPGNLTQPFADAGTYDVDFNVANSIGVEGFNWLLDTAPVTHINHSMTNNGGSIAAAMDWAVRFQGVTVTLGSGNKEPGDSGLPQTQVICSETWNTLCIGSHEYHTYADRNSYRWSPRSRYENNNVVGPSGLERPHLLGPAIFSGSAEGGLYVPDISNGHNSCIPIQMYPLDLNMVGKTGNCFGITGTSFSAPTVLSAAIQTYQYEGLLSALVFPVVRKAVLMASATDANADGPINGGTTWSSTADGVDGAGAVNLGISKQILDAQYGSIGGFGGQYWYRRFVDSDFAVSCGANCREYTVGTVTVPQGKTLEVALAYNSCSSSRTQAPSMPNNYDLAVVQPAKCQPHITRQSASAVSEVEMVYDSCLTSAPTPGSGGYLLKVRLVGSAPLNTCGELGDMVALSWSIR
jgi:hypothetical protein